MPIFMPSHLSKYLFHQHHVTYDFRWPERPAVEEPLWTSEVRSPFQEQSPEAVELMVGFADYFRFPEVQYFESIPVPRFG